MKYITTTSSALVFLFTVTVLHGQGTFPLSNQNGRLDDETIEAAFAEVQENDVDVSKQNALLYKGLGLSQDEEYEEAILFLEEALRMDPSMTAGWEALGWAYVRIDRPEHAFQLWEYFRTLMPNSWMPYNLLAQASILQQNWVKADEMFRKMLEIQPTLYDQRYWFAQNLLRIGKMDEAEVVLRQLVKEEPGRLDIQIDLANLITHQFGYAEAVQIWRHINAELPGNPRLQMNQAELEVRVGELRAANALCEEVLAIEDVNELFPDDARRARALRVDIADFEDASSTSIKRLNELIDQTEDPVERGQLRLRLANRCQLQLRVDPTMYTPDEILSLIRASVNDDPNNLAAKMLYAEQCIVAGRYRSAEAAAKHILENFNANNIRAKDVLFECALHDRRFDDASQIAIDRFSKVDPTDPMRYRFLARIHMAKGEFAEALRLVDQMEAHAQRGSVLTLLYHGLTESDWITMTSARRLREHANSLLDAGFVFIAPSDIPKYAGLREGESSIASIEKKPWIARTLHYLIYQVTGYRRFRPGQDEDFRDKKPAKYVAVTFDDGLRSSFALGTDVAQYVGVPFGMFVVTKPQEEYQPSVAGWEEVRQYAKTGAWEIGSQLSGAHEVLPADRDGKDLRNALPNRLWLPLKNRLESINEWDFRMRAEFRKSRADIRRELGDLDCEIPMVAYPFGDIGQESSCNLYDLRNPVKSITSEASRSYRLGFFQNASGYTSVGDNLLLCRRYEPRWDDEGADVVRAIYEFHPVFMARRTRIELALYMNKPHMAEKMIELMRRDGYPEELCREIEREVLYVFRNIPHHAERAVVSRTGVANETEDDDESTHIKPFDPFAEDLDADTAVSNQKALATSKPKDTQNRAGGEVKSEEVDSVQLGDESPWVEFSDPFVYGELLHAKANEQFEVRGFGIRAGFNPNPRTTVSAEWFQKNINQTIHPRWNAVTNDMTKAETREFTAKRNDYRLRWSHRMDNGAAVSASFGTASLDLNYNDKNTFELEDDPGSGEFYRDDDGRVYVGDIGIIWNPRNDMRLHVYYIRDIVQSAVKLVKYDSLGGEMDWRPIDALLLSTHGRYWSYSDDNALFSMQSSALLEILPDVGVFGGVEASTVSSSRGCDYYWTPYWDQQVLGLIRYKRQHKGYEFELDFKAGLQREDSRPLRRRQDDGLSGASDWGYIWGFGGRYFQDLTDIFSVAIEGDVKALRDYVDHQIIIGVTAKF